MKIDSNSHKFALYTEIVKNIVQHKSNLDIHEITDQELINRIINILRLKRDEKIILFDSHNNILCTIIDIKNLNSIVVELHEISHNQQIKPHIKWLLPIYKKEAFEESIYTLTEMGVQSIQPIITKKIQKIWYSQKDQDRSKRIMIAAAEQSKQFILPELLPILPLEIYLSKSTPEYITKIFFDPAGSKLLDVVQSIKIEHNQIIGFVGPESDLTSDEKIMLSQSGFVFCALTKTILRAQQAIAVGLGSLRSLL